MRCIRELLSYLLVFSTMCAGFGQLYGQHPISGVSEKRDGYVSANGTTMGVLLPIGACSSVCLKNYWIGDRCFVVFGPWAFSGQHTIAAGHRRTRITAWRPATYS